MKQTIRAQFNRQAACYLQGSGMDDPAALDRMVEAACPSPTDRALDIACGAGFLTLALARHAAAVTGVDLSERMLAEAERLRIEQRAGNVAFLRGDVEGMPFEEERFNVVTCKLAFHYFPDPARALAEMRRVLAPGGRLVMMDRVASEDPERRAWHLRIERLRSPVEVRLHTPSEITALIREAVFEVTSQRTWMRRTDFEGWVRRRGCSEEMARHTRDLMIASIHGDRAGLDPQWEGGRLTFSMPEVLIVALKKCGDQSCCEA